MSITVLFQGALIGVCFAVGWMLGRVAYRYKQEEDES